MSKTNTTEKSGVSFAGLLSLVFLVLKLTNTVDWSWWWITAPLWGGFALVAVLLVIWLLVMIAVKVIKG